MKRLPAIGALACFAVYLCAQGLNPGGQTKDDWEEINFEFNSAILSDAIPACSGSPICSASTAIIEFG